MKVAEKYHQKIATEWESPIVSLGILAFSILISVAIIFYALKMFDLGGTFRLTARYISEAEYSASHSTVVTLAQTQTQCEVEY
jgi:hypothetical protein